MTFPATRPRCTSRHLHSILWASNLADREESSSSGSTGSASRLRCCSRQHGRRCRRAAPPASAELGLYLVRPGLFDHGGLLPGNGASSWSTSSRSCTTRPFDATLRSTSCERMNPSPFGAAYDTRESPGSTNGRSGSGAAGTNEPSSRTEFSTAQSVESSPTRLWQYKHARSLSQKPLRPPFVET